MTPEEQQWMAIYTAAGLSAPPGGPSAVPNLVKGRFIAALATKLVLFWGRHKATLIPFLSQIAIAALDAMVAALPAIQSVDPPGPI